MRWVAVTDWQANIQGKVIIDDWKLRAGDDKCYRVNSGIEFRSEGDRDWTITMTFENFVIGQEEESLEFCKTSLWNQSYYFYYNLISQSAINQQIKGLSTTMLFIFRFQDNEWPSQVTWLDCCGTWVCFVSLIVSRNIFWDISCSLSVDEFVDLITRHRREKCCYRAPYESQAEFAENLS